MTKTTEKPVFEPQVWNAFNARFRTSTARKFTMPSKTVPDQTMSMRRMLEKHVQGIHLPVEKEGIFDDETEQSDGIHPKTLDLVDIQAIAEETQETMSNYQKSKEKAAERLKKAEKDRQLDLEREVEELRKLKPEGH